MLTVSLFFPVILLATVIMYHLTVLVDGSLHAVHYAHYKIQCCKTWDNMSGSSTFIAPSLSVITYYFSKGTHLWILQKRDSVANKYIEHSTYMHYMVAGFDV